MMGATGGLGYVSQVMVIGDFSLLGSCGPSLARIAFDNWGLLSRCLFNERQVEFELSSWEA